VTAADRAELARTFRRAADHMERFSRSGLAMGCCQAIDMVAPVTHNSVAHDEFRRWFRPAYASAYWWPLNREGILPRLVALDLAALILEEEVR
jgi:hypothetical protein